MPYAETGPSSDVGLQNITHSSHLSATTPTHTQTHTEQRAESPEEPRLHQVEDGGVTIIANPHSLASESPPPSTPAVALPTAPPTSSGSSRQYQDNPVGDRAYLSAQYTTEQPLTSRPPQSGPSSGLPVGATPPPLPPRVLLKPSAAARDGGSARENKSLRVEGLEGRLTASERKRKGEQRRVEKEKDEEEEGMKKRVSEYLQAAQEEGEKRQVCVLFFDELCSKNLSFLQSFMNDVNFFTDINLDMTTQTAL